MDKKLIERITVNPEVMVGKPTIRGTRVTVEVILEMLAAGVSEEGILANYPGLAACRRESTLGAPSDC